MTDLLTPDFEKELYYLIFKFLNNGPCKEAAETLKSEIDKNKLVVLRKDWLGNDHIQNFRNYDSRNNHVPEDYLLQLSQRLNPLTEKCFPASVRSLTSLLSRGNLSLLRQDNDSQRNSGITTSRHAACLNNSPKILPSTSAKVSIVPLLHGSSLSGTKKHASFNSHCNLYSKISMQKQILGHLASVYCVSFDRTGSVIVTGADDNLLKVWSTSNGRLISTFRGHSGQIADIAINKENTLLASGSNDKTIRVWDLHNSYPIAVLQGHTGIITSLQFCPGSLDDVRYLASTGGDGHVCFWSYNHETLEFNLTPIRYNEKTRPGSQMLCSSFSAGGGFLATGSSDNYIRIYQLYPSNPEKVAELPNHADHVDSILYSNTDDRFLSGSRDGTAMIWYYNDGDWQAKCLDASKKIEGEQILNEDTSHNKLKVTMICWSLTDHYVITAGSDCLLRVWNSHTAKIVNVLRGHTDEIYILEIHKTEPNILLSAGHDGNIILWDLERFEKIKVFFNLLEGQGHGAIFDSKFSPTGLQIAATDSHGHLLIFGFGSEEPFKSVPFEQFFHTDYRPIIRDANNYVLDEQTQTAPHLMPPPFLVDIDGNPYSSQYQLLIPGRNSSNQPQLRPEQQDLPPLLAQIEAAERGLRSPTVSRQPSFADAAAALLSPGGGLGLRESGDVEGVRQQNDMYVSGDITDADAEAWRNRVIIHTNTLYNQQEDNEARRRLGLEEIRKFKEEKLKAELNKISEVSPSDNTRHFLRSTSGRGRGRGRGRTRQARVRQHVSYVRGSAMQSHNVSQPSGGEVVNIDGDDSSSESEPEDWQGESSDTDDSDWAEELKVVKEMEKSSRGRRKQRRISSEMDVDDDDEEEDKEIDVEGQNSSPTSSRSSVDTDDEMKRKSETSDSNLDSSSELTDTQKQSRRRKRGKQKARKITNKSPVRKRTVKKKVKVKQEIKSKKPIPSVQNVEEYLKYYQPPEWLLSCECRKFPYVPQINDEVYYLRQGHMLYVQEVIKWNEYDIQEARQAYRRYDLSAAELCKLVGISYDVGPPKMCSLKLELIGKRKSTGAKKTITVRFHDMPHVVDFLVLRHLYEQSLRMEWGPTDRFRCIIDDSWYFGTIVEVSPLHEEFPKAAFLSLSVKWDSGDDERLSPWDLENIPSDEGIDDSQDNIPITPEDKLIYKYPTTDADWPQESPYDFMERVCKGLEDFSALEISSPFAFPVDVHLYPTYWSLIAFPTDLETIRKKIRNQFYRRLECVLWELRQLKSNASKFNEPGSPIVQDATLVVKVLSKFIKEPHIKDVIGLYNEMKESEDRKVKRPYYDDKDSDHDDVTNEDGEDDDDNDEEDEDEDIDVAGGSSNSQNSQEKGTSQDVDVNNQDWTSVAKNLLEFISSKDDAVPFRQPVDVESIPEYALIITEPMDISTIRHRLDANQYDNAEAFIRDVQLIFKNSKTFNTDRRSLIYKMTLRLSTLFESRCQEIRDAFAISEQHSHWTRTRTRNHRYRMDSISNNTPGYSGSSSSSSKRVNGLRSTVKTNTNNNSRNTNSHSSEQPCSSRRQIASPVKKKLTLQQFIQRPNTRQLEHEIPTTSTRSTRSLRNGRAAVATTPMNNHSNVSDSETFSESEEEVTPKQKSPQKTRSGRIVTAKRKRYGFDSDEEESPKQQSNKRQKPLPVKKITLKKTNKNNATKRKASKEETSRSSRRKTNVNYCEDELDEFEVFEEEREDENGNEHDDDDEEEEEEVVDTDNSSDDGNDSDSSSSSASASSSDDEQAVPVTGVSSRGRVRRAAARFTDFVDK